MNLSSRRGGIGVYGRIVYRVRRSQKRTRRIWRDRSGFSVDIVRGSASWNNILPTENSTPNPRYLAGRHRGSPHPTFVRYGLVVALSRSQHSRADLVHARTAGDA